MAPFSTSVKKNSTGLIVLLVALFLSYLIFFPRTVEPEFYFAPRSAADLTTVKGEPKAQEGFLFQLGNQRVYANPQGQPLFLLDPQPQMALSTEKYAFVNTQTQELEVWKPGQKLFSLPQLAYPYWSGERLYSFEPHLFGVTEISGGGQILWSRSYASPITALDAGKDETVVGILNGQVEILDRQGKVKGTYSPVSSRHLVIYNAKISPDDRRVAVLCGQEPKRFVLLDRGGTGEFQPVVSREVPDPSTSPTPLGFLANGTLVYYYNGKGLTLMDTQTFQERKLAFSGVLEWVDYNPQSGLFTLITRDQGKTKLSLFSQSGSEILDSRFQAQNFFIKQGADLYLGIDSSFLKMEEQRK